MQDLALAEGALPKHLHSAMFTKSTDNRMLTNRSDLHLEKAMFTKTLAVNQKEYPMFVSSHYLSGPYHKYVERVVK